MNTLPIIDISGLRFNDTSSIAKQSVLKTVEDACRCYGFMVVRGHGIELNTIKQLRHEVGALFALPLAVKNKYLVSSSNYRGYIPLGFFDANQGGFAADQYEGYKLHFETAEHDSIRSQCDLYGPNKWPTEAPGLQIAVERYWRACDQLTLCLLRAFERILDAHLGFFTEAFRKPLTNMTLLHYPAAATDGHYGIHPHKDTDVLTIVAPDPGGGLYLRPRGHEQWIAADAPPDCLVINIGDMLELWSGGYLVSTPHKVVNRNAKSRISFPYFAVPSFDTTVRSVRTSEAGFQRQALNAGDISREVWRTNWAGASPKDPNSDLGTLKD